MSSETVEADVIVIGSGVTGALTAYKLAQKGFKCVILEAGPRIERADIVKKFTQTYKFDFSAGFPNEDWAPRPDWDEAEKPYFDFTGPESFKVEYIRAVGGTTWHWSGFAARLCPEDLKMQSTYGVGVDWPFGYETLEPWYCEAEKELGVAGDANNTDAGDPKLPQAFRSKPYPMPPVPRSYGDGIIEKKLNKIGITFASPPAARATQPYDGRPQCMGFGSCSPICPSGAQYAAIYHINKVEKMGVRVMENTRVDRINADPSGKITDVVAMKSDGTKVTARGRLFVLAANGMESPRLLLMSANDHFSKGLANSSGRLGRYLYEHPAIVCRLVMPEPVYPRGPEATMGSVTFRRGDFRRKHAGWSLGVHNFPHHHEAADALLKTGLEGKELDAAIRKRAVSMIDINTQIEHIAREENGITLDWTRRDRAGQPVMQVHYSFSDYEKTAFGMVRDMFGRIIKAMDAEMLSISDPVAQHHPLGMAMMGHDQKKSVTDAFGRCHDHKNLFVAGMAILPACGMSSPTLTISALALRSAEEIARQLKG